MKQITIIPSKSDAHRAIICSGLSANPCNIEIAATSKDIEATRECMAEIRKAIADPDYVANLECGESGSTFRFLIPVVAALGINCKFWPKGRLPNRPLSPLYEELIAHGAKMSPVGTVPFEVSGKLEAGEYRLPGNVSSQYISGLIFALPLLEGDSRIVIEGKLESAGYVDMTLRTVGAFGIEINSFSQKDSTVYEISGNQKYVSDDYHVEGDWSNAAFWIVAGIIGKDAIRIDGLDIGSAQGDKRIVELTQAFGADVSYDSGSVISRPSAANMSGITIDAGQIPDMVPALALTASMAKGETRIVNAGRLRIKESDRLRTVTEVLNAIGGNVTELEDSLVIQGVEHLTAGTVNSHNDHRIAMMAAIASLASDGVITIEDADAVQKSYPGFYEEMSKLGLMNQVERG